MSLHYTAPGPSYALPLQGPLGRTEGKPAEGVRTASPGGPGAGMCGFKEPRPLWQTGEPHLLSRLGALFSGDPTGVLFRTRNALRGPPLFYCPGSWLPRARAIVCSAPLLGSSAPFSGLSSAPWLLSPFLLALGFPALPSPVSWPLPLQNQFCSLWRKLGSNPPEAVWA